MHNKQDIFLTSLHRIMIYTLKILYTKVVGIKNGMFYDYEEGFGLINSSESK